MLISLGQYKTLELISSVFNITYVIKKKQIEKIEDKNKKEVIK